jgi:hypothetical protein
MASDSSLWPGSAVDSLYEVKTSGISDVWYAPWYSGSQVGQSMRVLVKVGL